MTREGLQRNLLCYVEGDPSPELIEWIATAQSALAASRSWCFDAPEFVNESSNADLTLGVVLRIAETADGSGDVPVQQHMLDDVQALVSWAERLSAETDVEFGFELDGDSVGWVEDGHADSLLTQGLIGPWRAHLSSLAQVTQAP